MKIVDVPLNEIEVGERRRQDYGDIGALAKGIERVGLREPIIVDRNGKKNHYRLVAGERRLRAASMLKWPTIPAQLVEHLSETELRDIELEENENRKPLTECERTRTFTSAKRLVDSAKRAAQLISQGPCEKDPRGRKPRDGAAKIDIAAALGVSHQTIRNAEQQIETAQRFPFMQTGNWRQSDVLRIRERIEELPEEEREQAAGVLGCAKLLDPDMAVDLMENLGAKTLRERQEIYELSRSDDPREISLALTEMG
jgi:ParB family chromosome partitioning protein